MTDSAPIPPEAFEDAVDRLDRDALAEFVGRLEAAAGGTVEIDPPVVTVDDGEERIVVAADGADSAAALPDSADPTPDAVVAPEGAAATDRDVPVRTMEDLRQQLLYAASPETAESIAEEFLGAAARSTTYAPEPRPTAASGGSANANGATDGDPTPDAADDSTVPASEESTATASAVATAGATAGTSGGSQGSPTQDSEVGMDAVATRNAAVLVVVGVVMILAVTGGVVYAAEVSADGDAGAFAAPVTVGDGGLSDAEIRRGSRESTDESGAVATATATPMSGEGSDSDGHPLVDDTEENRNVRPVPTCERSFLHVVQIQMNALKYNNNTTDDGIRTVRRFASPRNRQTIQTFDEFARIIKSSTYSPMLSYDSVQYTPIQSSDDYAQVQVITREDDNVTGRYYFRLGKVDHGEYEGCWMTDAVVSVPETNNFSGKVGAQSTGTNETS